MSKDDIKKIYYEAYLNQKIKTLTWNEVSSFSIKDRLEYDLLFYSLSHSDILKNFNLEYSNLELNNIEKSERPDFKLINEKKIIGIEIKNFRSHKDIANRVNEKMRLGISYEDLKIFLKKEDKENFIKYIETDINNKPIGLDTSFLNLNNSIEECLNFIDRKINNAMTYQKVESLFIVIAFWDEFRALNLLDDLLLNEKFSKYKKYLYYKNSEHSKLILKLY